jgi:tetratricopeptide (TPR) repeat protein
VKKLKEINTVQDTTIAVRGLAATLVLALAQGCASFQSPMETARPTAPVQSQSAEPVLVQAPPAYTQTPEEALQFHVLAAEMAAQRGVLPTAAQHYFEAAQLSTKPDLAERATRIALVANDEALALAAAQRWIQLAPKAVPPHEVIARHHLRQGNAEEALRECQAIVAGHSEGRDEGFREVALLLSGEQDRADLVLDLMRRLVEPDAKRARAHYAYGVLAHRLQRYDLAEAEARQAMTLDPAWPDAYLLKASTLVKKGQFAEADKTVAQILAKHPKNLQIRLGYARMLIEAEQPKLAVAQYQAVRTTDAGNPEALFALGLLALNARNQDEAYGYFKTLFDVGERRDDAAWYLGQIDERRGKLREAFNWYGQVTEGAEAYDAAIRRVFLLQKLEGMDSARRFLGGLRENNPDLSSRLLQVEADLYFETGKHQEALQVYGQALAESPDDPEILYGHAMVEAELGRVDQAERRLQTIIEKQPDDARSLNALGYLLSNHSQRYQEALSYIDRALKLTPEDPAVIDSMGWIQYRLGNLQEALKFLEDAFKRQQDPEIAAHLGEVLWHLGNQDKAKAVWQGALSQDPNHRVLRETVNRFNK